MILWAAADKVLDGWVAHRGKHAVLGLSGVKTMPRWATRQVAVRGYHDCGLCPIQLPVDAYVRTRGKARG